MEAKGGAFYTRLKQVANKFDHKTAVVYYEDEDKTVTLKYENILQICDSIYQEMLCVPYIIHTCFGILMDYNPYIPAVILCILKLDCAYVLLNTDINDENLIKKLNIKYVFRFIKKKHVHEQPPVIVTMFANETDAIVLQAYESDDYGSHLFHDINYVVQTSGTTDIKQIVKVEHYCIISNIESLKRKLKINENDVIYFGTNLTFDPSIVELYLALTTGATLFMVSHEIRSQPYVLYKTMFLNNNSIVVTFLQMCPSVFLRWGLNEMANILQNSALRILLLGGEQFPEHIIKLNKSKDLKIFNVYGITEVSCWAALQEVNENEPVPLGAALCDTMLEVRDESGTKIEEGMGELHIGSHKRICYVNEESHDNISRPLFRATGDIVLIKDEKIYFKNRKNDIIKRYGFRVNLQQIENSVFKETRIENKCIWLKDLRKLVLYIKLDERSTIIQRKILDKLRVKLLHLLQKECFPDKIEVVSAFALTKNGKVNKSVLENMAYESVQSNVENFNLLNAFSTLWCKYFGFNESDGQHFKSKSFYDLGGNSILAQQFSTELKELSDGDFTSRFFDYIFSNSYEDVCTFVKNFDTRKRKLSDEHTVFHNKSLKTHTALKLKIKWSYDLLACVDSSPTILGGGNIVAIGGFSNIFVVLNAINGQEISKTLLPNAIESACCTSYCGNFIYVGCYDGNMYCLKVLDGSIIWQYVTLDKIKNKPCLILHNSAIVFGSYDKFVHCVDVQGGKKIWKTHLGEGVSSDPLYLESKSLLFIATIHGSCYCLNEACGDVIWKQQLDYPIFGSPCILNNCVLWPTVQGIVHSVDCETGKKVWNFRVDGNVFSSLVTHEKYVIFGCHDKNIYCLESNNCNVKLKFRVSLDSVISSSVCVTTFNKDIYVIAASSHGCIYFIHLNDGCVETQMSLETETFSTPVVNNCNLFIGCRDNNLYCIEIQSLLQDDGCSENTNTSIVSSSRCI